MVGKGDRGPLADSQGQFDWGDYLTTRPVFPDRTLFAAAGYSLIGNVDGDNLDATPRFVIFGRAAAGGGGGVVGGCGGAGAGGGNGGGAEAGGVWGGALQRV